VVANTEKLVAGVRKEHFLDKIETLSLGMELMAPHKK